jgi:hypothetical protein
MAVSTDARPGVKKLFEFPILGCVLCVVML